MEEQAYEQIEKLMDAVTYFRPAQRCNKRWSQLGQLLLNSGVVLRSVEEYRNQNMLPKDSLGLGKALSGTLGSIVENEINNVFSELSQDKTMAKEAVRIWIAFLERDPICYHDLLYRQDRNRYDQLGVTKSKIQQGYSYNERTLARDYEDSK